MSFEPKRDATGGGSSAAGTDRQAERMQRAPTNRTDLLIKLHFCHDNNCLDPRATSTQWSLRMRRNTATTQGKRTAEQIVGERSGDPESHEAPTRTKLRLTNLTVCGQQTYAGSQIFPYAKRWFTADHKYLPSTQMARALRKG